MKAALMRNGILVIGALFVPAVAMAQTPTEAFECRLAYRATLEAAATLPILSQTERPADAISGAVARIEFDPTGLRVLGVKPLDAGLRIIEPSPRDVGVPIKALLSVGLPPSSALDDALLAFVPGQMPCRPGASLCYGSEVFGRGQISVDRSSPQRSVLTCEFEVREADLAQ